MGSRHQMSALLKASPNHLQQLYRNSKLNGNMTMKPSAKKHWLLMRDSPFSPSLPHPSLSFESYFIVMSLEKAFSGLSCSSWKATFGKNQEKCTGLRTKLNRIPALRKV